MHVGDMDALALARGMREAGLAVPVVLLAYDGRELKTFLDRNDTSDLAGVFLWQGDVTVLLAIVKYIEDRLNVAQDTALMGVQVIIVIEDNVRYYSSFLPVIYTELMHHSERLAPDGVNASHRLMRIQARPKILLCRTFEEAWACFSTYRENVLGVISDIEFPVGGVMTADAGVEFARRVRHAQPDVPVMLQSSVTANAALAEAAGASFLLKDSPLALHDLRSFMVEQFGFGDFVFKTPDRGEVGRANDLKSLEEHIRVVPGESIAYHSARNHFSKWLKARTEFALAAHMRPRKVSDFPTVEHLREDLLLSIQQYRQRRRRAAVADFDRETFDSESLFSRIGGGSLGGKARGLAFVNMLLDEYEVRDAFPDVRIAVPPTVVVATDVFDAFLDDNGLRDFAMGCEDDEAIVEGFLRGRLPSGIVADLQSYLDLIRYPLAIRSSSLLEDSQYQPFAGIYSTYMLPNNHPDAAVRLEQLLTAIRRVYASTFSQHAKRYLGTTPYRLEEEKMAVIIQKVVGSRARAALLPEFRGRGAVAQLLPGEADDVDRRGGRRRPRPRRQRRGRRAVPAVLPALSPAPAAVLVREGRPQELAARFLRAAARRRRSGGGRAGRGRAGALRPRGRRAGRDAARGGVCVLAGERRDLRRSFTGRREARQLCAHPQARSFPAG